jgi:hypothetical protein
MHPNWPATSLVAIVVHELVSSDTPNDYFACIFARAPTTNAAPYLVASHLILLRGKPAQDPLDAVDQLLVSLRGHVGEIVTSFPSKEATLRKKVWSGGVLNPDVNFYFCDGNEERGRAERSRARKAAGFAGTSTLNSQPPGG